MHARTAELGERVSEADRARAIRRWNDLAAVYGQCTDATWPDADTYRLWGERMDVMAAWLKVEPRDLIDLLERAKCAGVSSLGASVDQSVLAA